MRYSLKQSLSRLNWFRPKNPILYICNPAIFVKLLPVPERL